MRADRKRLIADGFVAGLVGYALVVSFFLVWNLAAGRPAFHTPALLGAILFGGLRDPALLVVDPGLVIAFNGVHLLAFLLAGFAAAWLVYETERHPELWYVAFFLFVIGSVAGYAAVLVLSLLVGRVLGTVQIVGASLLAGLGMAGYLVGTHRGVLRAAVESGDRLGTAG